MFNRASFDNSRPDGIGVLEIVPGPEPGPDEPRLFVPLKRTELTGEVTGPLASLRLVQVYAYSREACDRTLEAVYRFPLPGDAAVTGVSARFGEVEIRAELKERAQAEQEYAQAKQEGRQAALATRESPDVFTLQVAGLQPDQEVTVETSYVQLARPEGRGWSLRIPLTTSPRYVREDERGSRPAQGQPLLLLRDPGHRFRLDLALPGAGAVESATHPLATQAEGDGLRVRLRDGEILPDRDCVLSWRPRAERDAPALQVFLHEDPASAHVYYLALVSPPEVSAPGQGAPREVVLLVDHSGSMQGPKWEAADWAVKRFLSELGAEDWFTLGLFHDSTRWFSKAPCQGDEPGTGDAVRFLDAHRDSGGTNLGVALEQALRLERAKGDLARHVLIVTDAEVTDSGRILRLADSERAQAARRRVSVLCIDAAPNSFLAMALAERGGGIAKFLTSSPEEEDITTALDEVLADWSRPVLAGLRLEVSRPEGEAAGRDALPGNDMGWGWSAVDLGDLPAGRAVWVAGRVPRGDAPDLSFRLAAGSRKLSACRLPLAGSPSQPSLKALFGARRVLGLETLIHGGYEKDELRAQLERLGYDPDRALESDGSGKSVYAENAREETKAALRGLLVKEALAYGLASAETAFIAARKERGQPVEGTVAVANALPAGWSGAFAAGMASGGGGALYRLAASAMPIPPPPSAMPGPLYAANIAAASAVPPDADDLAYEVPAFLPARRSVRSAGPPEVKVKKEVAPLFSGVPGLENGEAVLFDSSRKEDEDALPKEATFSRLRLRFPAGAPSAASVDADLYLLLYVGDLASPRARVRLRDLVKQGGERPVNLVRRAGEVVRIVLADPRGAWASGAPEIEVVLQ